MVYVPALCSGLGIHAPKQLILQQQKTPKKSYITEKYSCTRPICFGKMIGNANPNACNNPQYGINRLGPYLSTINPIGTEQASLATNPIVANIAALYTGNF